MKLFPTEIYVNRREKFMNLMSSGIVIFPGNNDSPMNYAANPYVFRQDSTFLYFWGLKLSGLAAIMDIDNKKATIYGDDVDISSIIWMGPQPSIKELSEKVGVVETKSYKYFETDIKEAISKQRKMHYLPQYRHDNMILLNKILEIPFSELKNRASAEAIKAVVALRSVKENIEIQAMTLASEIAYKMHLSAMKNTCPGIMESEISGVAEGIALSHNGKVAFPIICTIKGEILHNHYHGNIMKDGDLLLIDAGAETEMSYCSDFTRTIPVNGKFSSKQKEIYQIVLEANNKAFELVKPSVANRDIHLEVCKIITKGLIELGLMRGSVDEIVAAGAHALFFPHGLGHLIGLDVHDMEDLGENYVGYDDEIQKSTQFGLAYLRFGKRLQEGYTLTIEPGIYFIPALIEKWKKENINHQFLNFDKIERYIGFGGIRLEDDVLVTAMGGKFIGERLPITVEEVEKARKIDYRNKEAIGRG